MKELMELNEEEEGREKRSVISVSIKRRKKRPHETAFFCSSKTGNFLLISPTEKTLSKNSVWDIAGHEWTPHWHQSHSITNWKEMNRQTLEREGFFWERIKKMNFQTP